MTPVTEGKRVRHKSMAHLLCYLLHNPIEVVASSFRKKGIILYRSQILTFSDLLLSNRQSCVHKKGIVNIFLTINNQN